MVPGPRLLFKMRPEIKLRWYVGALVISALAMLWTASFAVPASSGPFWNCFVAFVALSILSETASISNRIGTSSSVVFVPYLASIILLGRDWAMVVAGVTVLVVEVGVRKKPLIKVAHNTAKEIVSVGLAAGTYALLGGQSALSEFHLSIV